MIHQSLFISIQNSPTRILIVFLKYIQVQDMKKKKKNAIHTERVIVITQQVP